LARCDLHLHSNASINQEAWIARHFGCPESYAEPLRQYELCKARGMRFVTLTDHDTIAGGLTLIDRPDFFLSEEVTSQVPEDGCIVHVLAWNITPAQHEGLQRTRRSVYELVDFLRSERIAHGLAHPLDSPNWRLTARTLEKLLLLFSTFEVVNGRADDRLNAGVSELLRRVDRTVLERLGSAHGRLPARGDAPAWAVSAGSDDHELRRAAACYTEVAGAADAAELLHGVMTGVARVSGSGADVENLGLAFGHTTYGFLRTLADEGTPIESPFADVMDAIAGRLDPGRARSPGQREFMEHVLRVADSAPSTALDIREVGAAVGGSDALAAAQIATADELLGSALRAAFSALAEANFFAVFGALRDAAGAIKAMVPFLFAADHLGAQCNQMERVRRDWTATAWPPEPPTLAIFSDSLSHVDGVSVWCQRRLQRAVERGERVLVPHSGPVTRAILEARIAHCFEPIPEVVGGALPQYEGLHFTLPSLVRTLAWLQRRRVTHLELATPGPVGLVGLIAGRLLRLSIRATYHTEVPGLVRLFTGSTLLEGCASSYLCWFYQQLERVVVFSEAARSRLIELGVDRERLALELLAVDPSEFSPDHLGCLKSEPLAAERPIVLSVGRLSPEKNLQLLMQAVAQLADVTPRPQLVIVGDGPERSKLEGLAAGRDDVRLIGARNGVSLKRLYAAASAFVFASEIDTLGLVAMEAMASGTPVLVPRTGSIARLVEHRHSAYCYEPTLQGLEAGLREVLGDPALANCLRQNGRAAMVERWRQTESQSAASLGVPLG
jgi:glycosyltransferase involved in cell wall biosynthesis